VNPNTNSNETKHKLKKGKVQIGTCGGCSVRSTDFVGKGSCESLWLL